MQYESRPARCPPAPPPPRSPFTCRDFAPTPYSVPRPLHGSSPSARSCLASVSPRVSSPRLSSTPPHVAYQRPLHPSVSLHSFIFCVHLSVCASACVHILLLLLLLLLAQEIILDVQVYIERDKVMMIQSNLLLYSFVVSSSFLPPLSSCSTV